MKMIQTRYLIALLVGIVSFGSYGQYYNLYEDDFETDLGWNFDNGLNNNHFVFGECAGNTFPTSGNTALYVAPMTGTGTDCTAGSQVSFAYNPTASGNDTVWAYKDIIYGGCGNESLVVTLDYKCTVGGNSGAAFVYRLNSSDQWTTLSLIGSSATWQALSLALPSALNGQDFQLGVRFAFDDIASAGVPLAIDNLVVKGLDKIKPTITCPATHQLYGDTTCSTVLLDLKGLVTVNDNCTPTAQLLISMNPNIGEQITGDTQLTYTVKDASNNEETCITTISIIDTIKPKVTCVYSYTTTTNNTNCDFAMPDVTSLVLTIQDNCSVSNFITTQSPLAGTNVTGAQDVTLSVADEQGNIGTCIVKVLPTDTVAPTIICPADKSVSNGTTCLFTMPDYTNEATVADNCILMPTNQNPNAGQAINIGIHTIELVVRDQSGNVASCTFNLEVLETEAPVFTNCPTAIATCNPLVTFDDLTATDNCSAQVTKADNTNLHSGDVFPVGTTQLEYEATDLSGNVATCAFSVTVYDLPETPTLIQNPIEICNQTSVAVVANPVSQGTGFWSLPPSSTLTITNPNQANTTVSGLEIGDNNVIWNTSSQHCGDSSITLIIKNSAAPSTATISVDSTFSCNDNTFILSAQQPQIGSGKWSADDTTIVFSNPNNHNVMISEMNGGWNTFYYTVSNGVCPASIDSVKLFKMVKPEILNFPSDTTLCEQTTLHLEGTVPPSGISAMWYFDQGNGKFSDEESPTTDLSNYKLGTSVLVYSFTHPFCGLREDTLILTYNNCDGKEFVIPTLITPNQDGKNDYFVIDGLNAKYPTCRVTIVNRYGNVVFESKGYAQPWEGTYNGKLLPVGTYYYVIDYNDGSGNKLTGPISIVR
ncbi:MAG TPA: HYR domain-containing protein [Crocinitomicaceae bacterium]|nr:HYR domain-containing protein [Crocinitomicaceae bacterium]